MLRSPLCLLLACILFTTFFDSCTKIDNTGIGADLLPAVDNVNTFEKVVPVIANNFDTAKCALIYPVDDHVLGYIGNDPYFGTTTAAIYTELKPASFPYVLPATFANITLDSAVLVLSYKRVYGDSTMAQKVNVYQVTTNGFRFDSSTCTQQTFNPLLLGSAIYTPQNLKDTIKSSTDSFANQLRIRLDDGFARSILSRDTNNAFKSDSLFKEFFKGFAIVPDIGFGGNALTYYSLTDTNTKLSFYFKYPVNSVDTAVVVNFRLTASSATANSVVRNRNGAEITDHTNHPAEGDDVIYIQTEPGSFAQIKIPGLDTLPNMIVHRAELSIEQVYSPDPVNAYLTGPDLLYLDFKYSDTTRRPIPCDFNILSGQPNFTTFGGFRKTGRDAAGNIVSKYTFDISRYVQKIITNKNTNYTLSLSAPDYITNYVGYIDDCGQTVTAFNYLVNYVTVGRIKLGGGNNLTSPMKLTIIYSKI